MVFVAMSGPSVYVYSSRSLTATALRPKKLGAKLLRERALVPPDGLLGATLLLSELRVHGVAIPQVVGKDRVNVGEFPSGC